MNLKQLGLYAAAASVAWSGAAFVACSSSSSPATTADAGERDATTDTGGGSDGNGGANDANGGGDTATGDTGATDAGTDAAPECTGPTCADGRACCNGRCVNTAKDPLNCGACGAACDASTQFCNGQACNEMVFQNVCGSAKATVIQDGLVIDDDAGARIGAALGGCTPAVSVRSVLQSYAEANDAGVLEEGGRPLTGPGDMMVLSGGAFGQDAVGYMQQADTPVAVSINATSITYIHRADSTTIKTVQGSDLNAGHDYFLMELATEPKSGTLTLISWGPLSPGTTAGGWYLQNVAIPQRATYDKTWYLYEWTDGNGNNAPDAPSEFALVASGR